MTGARPTTVARVTAMMLLAAAAGLLSAPASGADASPSVFRLSRSDLVVERVVVDRATGNPRLVTLARHRPVPDAETRPAKALALLTEHAAGFGLTDPLRELRVISERPDPLGGASVTMQQTYSGVPVFGAILRVHFDDHAAVRSINGTVVSDIELDPTPRIAAVDAEATALAIVAKQQRRDPLALDVTATRLTVYRLGLLRGRPGDNHLAWEVEIELPPEIHEVLYLDAHTGRLLDRRSEIRHLDRAIHQGSLGQPIWLEGDPLPYTSGDVARDGEVNELIEATGDMHALVANMTNGAYLGYDGVDGRMNAVYDSSAIDCPNAVESGGVTQFCVDMVSDDVVAHEWAHAYTEWTHALIYQWQPGALNEAYSDIFGELVDQLNARGADTPGIRRDDGVCSSSGGSARPTLEILSPASISGRYVAGDAVFNPLPPWTVNAPVELADDGSGVVTDACQQLVGFTAGSIALIDRGECFFRVKVLHAQLAGAAGVIVVNNQGDDVLDMGGDPPRLSIPAVFVGQTDGDRIRAALGDGVTAALDLGGQTSPSIRWIIGEDTTALGPIRDMWLPACFGDPGRVGSALYFCSELDNGGVHSNSGVPNHAFALLVDGGSSNGEHVAAIGATKAARIYWRAMSAYQTPVTNFAGHADLLEQSCTDLIDQPLYDLQTGALHPARIDADDCAAVAAAMRAVEMRADPDRCSFTTLLEPDPPPITGNLTLFEDDFDDGPDSVWSLTNRGVYPEYEPRDWVWTDELPPGGDGGAWFAVDSVHIGDCVPGSDDQSGVMELTLPLITIPEGVSNPVLSFDHWVATEADWDGGNLKIAVQGQPWALLPGGAFRFNPYNGRLNPRSGSNPNPNPLAGEPAFTGTDQGTLGGTWGQSQVDLSPFVGPGDVFVLRFDFGVDGCNGAVGWYIDNVRVTADSNQPRRIGGRVAP